MSVAVAPCAAPLRARAGTVLTGMVAVPAARTPVEGPVGANRPAGAAFWAGQAAAGYTPAPPAGGARFGPGQALPAHAAAGFGRALGADLRDVRVHTESPIPMQHGARAVTVGRDISFAPGAYALGTPAGQRLLCHELAHVVQQDGGTPGLQASGRPAAGDAHEHEADAAADAAVRGEAAPGLSAVHAPGGQGDTGPMCRVGQPDDLDERAGVCRAEQADPAALSCSLPAPAPEPLLSSTGPLAQRVAAFKALVRTTAVLRLRSNQVNLDQWSTLIASTLPVGDLAGAGMMLVGGPHAARELQTMRDLQSIHDPGVRELRAQQAVGHFRACTGCHIENQLWGTRSDRQRSGGREWMSPDEQRATPLGYRPTGIQEARLNWMFPDLDNFDAQLERARPVLKALGPEGYQVLTAEVLESPTPDAMGCRIRQAIRDRRDGYETLIGKISGGDLGYEHFGPIVRDLLPAADVDVRAAIQKEMDDHAFWSTVEAVVVGALTIAALIMTVFPPTSAAGLAAMGMIDIGLAGYGLATGPGMYRTGRAYALGTGANDVFSREQQEAAGAMILGGFFSTVMAPLGFLGGVSRMGQAAAKFGTDTTALTLAGRGALALEAGADVLRVGQTVQRGRYILTLAEDGALVVTLADHPEIMIIVRNGTATAYEVTGTGLRMLKTGPVPSGFGAGAGDGQLLLGPGQPLLTGPGESPLLPPVQPRLLPAPTPPAEPPVTVLPSTGPQAGQPPAYLLPMGPTGQGGVMLMGRGLMPADFGLRTIAEDQQLLRLWTDATRDAATTGRANAYTRYLDAVGNGTVTTWTSEQLSEAFNAVNSRFLAAARGAGQDVATVHHWNFPKSANPYSITDPRHLVPIYDTSAMRGGWHPLHQGGLHPLTTSNPLRPTAGPVDPVHAMDLTRYFTPVPQ
ncbi:DUF4157 domain-containing protein [Micromonospora sp. NPDC005806]|uniref:eCIS core domain-containing protein n=1 Tax=Micromonospora sp. NPDC005806 TaxID=3364234 RepID=UPI003695747B